MEEHEVKIITIQEQNVFKSVPVEYSAEYHYCTQADETYADDQEISVNDIAMKNAYRKKMGLLTSYQISAIRARYAWETESRVITTEKYMALVENSTPIGDIK
jgi:hypothetical protein